MPGVDNELMPVVYATKYMGQPMEQYATGSRIDSSGVANSADYAN